MPARLGPGGWPCHSILGWGPPWCSWGMWQEGQPLCRGGKGARHTHNPSSPSRRIADTVPQESSRREDAAQQGNVCEGYPRHASGRRGRRSLHPTLVELGNPGTNLLGPRLSRHDAKTNPPGTLRKERRTFLPLATIQPRAERTPTFCLTYAGGTRPRGRTLGRVAWGERKPWLSTAAHSGSHTAPSPGGLPAVRDRGEVRP